MIPKFWIIFRIKGFERKLTAISLVDEDPADLRRWYRNFEAFLSQLYPNGSDLASAASRVLESVGQDYFKASGPTPLRSFLDYKVLYRDGFQEVLEELRVTIKEQGVPPGYRLSSGEKFLYSAILLLIGGVITIGSAFVVPYLDSNVQRDALQRESVACIKELKRTLIGFDDHYQYVSFDSAVNSFRTREMFDSGLYIKGMINLAEDARRKRDSMIDSALIQLQKMGVDIDTLRISRRLPVRMGTALEGRAKALGFDSGIIQSILRCDSL